MSGGPEVNLYCQGCIAGLSHKLCAFVSDALLKPGLLFKKKNLSIYLAVLGLSCDLGILDVLCGELSLRFTI